MKAPYTEDQFAAKLKASNLTLDEVRHDLRRSLTQNKLLSKGDRLQNFRSPTPT